MEESRSHCYKVSEGDPEIPTPSSPDKSCPSTGPTSVKSGCLLEG